MSVDRKAYEDARDAVIEAEDYLSIGGHIKLNPKEKRVHNILMKFKINEVKFSILKILMQFNLMYIIRKLIAGHRNPENLPSAMHFFKAKKLIERSKSYQFLRLMPKGALLHGHNSALVSSDWVIRNLTYYPGVLRCRNGNGVVILSFRKSADHNCTNYILVADERRQANNVEIYNQELEKSINLFTPTPEGLQFQL